MVICEILYFNTWSPYGKSVFCHDFITKIAELFFCFNTAEVVLGNQVGKFLDAFFQIFKQAVNDIKLSFPADCHQFIDIRQSQLSGQA